MNTEESANTASFPSGNQSSAQVLQKRNSTVKKCDCAKFVDRPFPPTIPSRSAALEILNGRRKAEETCTQRENNERKGRKELFNR